MTVRLALRSATLRRGDRTLFEGLDLEVRAGEALWVSGPNGIGKTSLLRLAAGLLPAERGRVTRDPCALADDRPALDEELPLGRALAFWPRLSGSTGDVQGALSALGLGGLTRVPVRYLSSGQLKRASLARLLMADAPLWLLDEPSNALDHEGLERLSRIIGDHLGSGGTVIAASHVVLPGRWTRLELGR